jgi:hypothetical protein
MRHWALCLLLATTLSCHAAESSGPSFALISVSGEGSVTAAPDMATVTVGVTTQEEDAGDALAANNRAMTALVDVLDGFDIPERDRRSTGFNINPRYERRDKGQSTLTITAYMVSNQMTIRYRDIDRLGDLLDAIVKSGGNSIGSLAFGNTNAAELRDEARKLAVANARHKAELYATEAGGEVGRVVSISEAGAATPRPEMRGAGAMMMAADSVPIAAGENEFRAVVNIAFELEQ